MKKNIWITSILVLIIIIFISASFVIKYNNDKKENINENDNEVIINEPYKFDEFYFIIGRLDENGPADFWTELDDNYKYIKDDGIYINDIKLPNTEKNDKIVLLRGFGIIVINEDLNKQTYRFFNNDGKEIKIINDNSGIHYNFITYDKLTKYPVAYYRNNNEDDNSYQKTEFLVYQDRVIINNISNDMLETEYMEKVNISKEKEKNIYIDGEIVEIKYNNENKNILVNNKEFIGTDSNIYYTNNLIILRYKSYGAYQYSFLNSNGEEIEYEDRSSVYPLPYRYKDVYIENNYLYITSICISKECYANNDFKPVKLELNYNGNKVYIIDANK